MKKKKWIYLIVIIILVVPVLWLYSAFNGNFITKQLSKRTLTNYLEETYPESEFNIGEPFYNFKDGGYAYEVIEIGEAQQKKYEFTVVGILGNHVHWDGIYYDNLDEALIRKLEKEASQELKEVFQEKVPEILGVSVWLEVLKGKYDSNVSWDKDFKPEEPMSIHVSIDATELTKEDVLQAAKKIQTSLQPYDYNRVTINANAPYGEWDDWNDWPLKYHISFDRDEDLKLKNILEENTELEGF